MRGTFGTLDARQLERMRQALAETLCTHFANPPFFDPRLGTDRVRPLDRNSLDAISHFVQSVNYSALDAIDVSSNEVRRFFEGLFLRYLQVNPAFKSPRHARYLPALRARVPRLAADVHRGLLASLEGKAPNFGAPPRKQSWMEGRVRARKLSQEDYERTTRILEAAIIRSRIDDYSNSGFVPQAEPADVVRRPPAPVAPATQPSPGNELQVVGPRHVIVPTGVHAFDLTLIGSREWLSKPAIRQRVLAPQAFGEIVERDDIDATASRQRALDRHVGRGDHAHRDAGTRLRDRVTAFEDTGWFMSHSCQELTR